MGCISSTICEQGAVRSRRQEGMEVSFFEDHKKLIVSGAATHTALTRVAAKYLWAANYRNTTMKSFGEDAFTSHRLRR